MRQGVRRAGAPGALRIAALAALSGTLACCLVSCAPMRDNANPAIEATAHIRDPWRALEARAELETLTPARPAQEAVLRALVPDARPTLAPGSGAYLRAMTEADAIDVPALAIGGEDIAPVPEEQRAGAIKLYTRARSMRLGGQNDEAVAMLRQAQRLDPASGPVARELGEALLASGDQVGAVQAFELAIELGDRSPSTLVHAASEAAARGDQDRVMALTSLALADRAIEGAPMTHAIAGIMLGSAQINSGHLSAGAQTLSEALTRFGAGSRDMRWRREIVQVLSQRAQLWVLAGDAWGAIGAHGRAQQAYEQAMEGENRPPPALVARRIAAHLREGRPAQASLAMLEHVRANVTDLASQERRWVVAMSGIPGYGDVIADALAQLRGREDLTPAIRRTLMTLEVLCVAPEEALERLDGAGPDANATLAVIRVLERIEKPRDRLRAASRLVGANPEIGRAAAGAMIQLSGSPVALLATHANEPDPSAQLLLTSVGIALGRADLIGHLDRLDLGALDQHTAAWLGAHAQALALTGRWQAASAIEAELRRRSEGGDEDATRRLASTLVVLQRPQEAWTLASGIANGTDAAVEDLLLGAQVAQVMQRPEAVMAYLERASELDPYDTTISEQLILRRGAGSPTGDEEELRRLVRQLGTSSPRSTLFGLLRATELAKSGMLDQAEALLLSLNARAPHSQIGFDLLLSIWKTQQSQGDADALAQGVAWLEEHLTASPNAAQTVMTLAQARFELGEYEQALALLESAYARLGAFEISRAIEQLLAQQLDRPEEARARADARLGPLRGVDAAVEYASVLAARGDNEATGAMLARLRWALPEDITLLPGQLSQLTQAVYALAEGIETLGNERQILDAIDIIDAHSPALGFSLARIKLLLLAQAPRVDLGALVAETGRLAAQVGDEQQRQTLRALPVQALVGEERDHEAIALVTLLATEHDRLDPDYGVELYRMLGAMGANSDMLGVLEVLASRGLMLEAIHLTTEALGTPERQSLNLSPDQQRADLVYTAAAMATAFGRDEQAGAYYELALSYDPDHAWANNDYGYKLIEAGTRMDEAIAMLERAAAASPDEASIIDSLGWARYKTGVLEDVTDAASGEVVTQGAITLLRRANALDRERDNATIVLHLGDALWRAGRSEQAREAWLSAENMVRERVRLLSADAEGNRRAIERLSAELKEIRYRIQDAEAGREPKVAPLAGELGAN